MKLSKDTEMDMAVTSSRLPLAGYVLLDLVRTLQRPLLLHP